MLAGDNKSYVRPNRYTSCWIVTDEGKVGTENQCVGLAQGLGLKYTLKRVRPKGIWKALPPRLWVNPLACLEQEIAPPWPSVIIGAGRASSAPVAYIREASQGRTKTIQLLNPYLNPTKYDVVIAPEHDQLNGPNVIATQGALNKITPEVLAESREKFAPMLSHLPRPLVAVLIGGGNRSYTLTSACIQKLVADLKTLVETHGVGLAVTVSRRTGAQNTYLLQKGLKDLPAVVWTGAGPNPYFGYLAHGDALIVTEDSISMTSEACYTGKPVYVVTLEGKSRKFQRFHQSMMEGGYTRPFDGTLEDWSGKPLRETQRVAEEVRKRLFEEPIAGL